MLFLILSNCLIGMMLSQFGTRGPRAGLWLGWLVALLLVPSWFIVKIGALSLDLKTIAATVGLVGMALFARRSVFRGCYAADGLILALVFVQLASEYQAGSFGILIVPDVVRVWLLPYLVGRCFFGSTRDASRSMSTFAAPMAAVALYAIVEAATSINPLTSALGKLTAFPDGETGYRWGLKRAQVFLDHPIYFGYLLVLLMPWSLHARQVANWGAGPRWWKWLPNVTVAALFCTGSRGPFIAGLTTLLGPFILARRILILPVLLITIACVVLGVVFKESTIDGITLLTGSREEAITITVDGREVEYSGTTHRLLQAEIYAPYFDGAGELGYGARLSEDKFDEIPERFRSIDCHYLLFFLQYGYLGSVLFLLLAGSSVLNLFRVASDRKSLVSGFAASLAFALVGVTALLVSVWFSPDFGAAFLFTAGLSCNLRSLAPLPRSDNQKEFAPCNRQT